MSNELSNGFALVNNIEPTSKSITELKQELCVAELRDIIVETVNSGQFFTRKNGKKQILGIEEIIATMDHEVSAKTNASGAHSLMFFQNTAKAILSTNFNQTTPKHELVETVYKAAIQSSLDVLKGQQTSPTLTHNDAIEHN